VGSMLFLLIILVILLAIAAWQIAPRINRAWWDKAKPGSIWFHDPTGTIVPEDQEFKKPSNEGDRL
jgi:hypothetical protein